MTGIGLLSREALAGGAIYVAGHGMVEGPLFICAGILLHRRLSQGRAG